jgi:protein TonB
MIKKALFIITALLLASCTGEKKPDGETQNVTVPTEPKFEKKTDEYFSAVEKMPEIVGGIRSIAEKIKYPEEAKKAGVEGTVYIIAYVDENGTVEKAEVLKGIGYGCDKVALEAIKNTEFVPGYNNGKPVKVKVVIPIRFKLAR